MKTCSRCGVLKEFSEFSSAKKGLGKVGAYCKVCVSAYHKEWYKKHPYQRKATPHKPRAHKAKTSPAVKTCRRCEESKSANNFYKCSKSSDGLRPYCRDCESKYQREKNPKTHYTARELGHKICRKCGEDKSISEFRDRRINGKKKGFDSWCKKCSKEWVSEYNKRKRERKYVPPQIYDACSICHRKVPSGNVCDKCKIIFDKKQRAAAQKRIRLQHLKMMKFRINRCVDCNAIIESRGARTTRCEDCQKKHERARAKERYHSDLEYRRALLEQSCQYQKNNRIKIAASDRRRRIENPTKERHKDKIRDYRERGAKGSHSLEQWNKLIEDTGHKCLMCGRSDNEVELTRDHIIPLSIGGTNYIENIQPLCRSCNSKKGNRNTIDLRPEKAAALYP